MLVDLKEILELERQRMDPLDFKYFKKLKKTFESENFKQVIRGTDEIIAAKKTKNLQYVLILKALSQYSIKEYESALVTAKQAISHNISNFDSWFVYGTMNLGSQKHEEAHKAFLQAEKSKTNRCKVEFYRDWNYLSFFRLDYQQLLVNSYYLMNLRAEYSYPWLTCAEAALRLKRYDLGLNALDTILQTSLNDFVNDRNIGVRNTRCIKRIFICNILKLKMNLLLKSDKYDSVLDLAVQMNGWKLSNSFFFNEITTAYVNSKKYPEALSSCLEALDWNCDNLDLINQYISLKKLLDSSISDIECLCELFDRFQGSLALKSLLVQNCSMEIEFQKAMFTQIVSDLLKRESFGFFKSNLASIKKEKSKFDIIHDLFHEYHSQSEISDVFYWRMEILTSFNGEFEKLQNYIKNINLIKCKSDGEDIIKYSLLAKLHYTSGNIEEAQNYARVAFDAEKTSKYLCSKAMKYYLLGNKESDAIYVTNYFTHSYDKIDHSKFYVVTCSVKQIYYFILHYIKQKDYNKLLESCFSVLNISSEFYSSIYDLYILASHFGNITAISDAYQSFKHMLSSKVAFFVHVLGFKLCLAIHNNNIKIVFNEKLPKYMAKEPLEGAHSFLMSLLKCQSYPEIINRLAAEYYATVGNSTTLERSLNLLNSSISKELTEIFSRKLSEKTPTASLTDLFNKLGFRNTEGTCNAELPANFAWMFNYYTSCESDKCRKALSSKSQWSPVHLAMIQLNKDLGVI